jgi:hypothetical protein
VNPWCVVALAILALSGCSREPTGATTKSLIFDAQLQFQGGNRQAALVCIQKAMASSHNDILDRASACELYDDAGLYYFATDDIEESRLCQSIAVLLSRSAQTPVVLQDFYFSNLTRIYGRLGKSGYLPAIRDDVSILLLEHAIRDDFYIKRYGLSQAHTDR